MRFATGAVLLLVVAGCATSYSGSQQNTTDDLLAELREIRDSRPIVEVEYDRFEEQTRYTSTRSAVLQSEYVVGNFFYLALTAWGQCEGEEGCIPEQVVFQFDSRTPGWRFLENHRLVLLYDGDRTVPETHHDGDVVSGRNVRERVLAPVDAETYRQIIYADSLEGRIGAFEFTVPDSPKKGLRALADSLSALEAR